jgi:rubrerythrin
MAEALSLAIEAEKEGYNFYNKIIEGTSEKRVKNELEYLRDEEMKHEALFKKILRDKNLKAVVNENSDLSCWVKAEIIEPMQEAIKNHKPDSSAEALKVGLQLENKSIEMFQLLKDASDGKESKEAIETILNEEKKHRKKLNIIMAY